MKSARNEAPIWTCVFRIILKRPAIRRGAACGFRKSPEKWSAPTNFCACSDETVAGWVSAFGFSQVKALVGGSSGRERRGGRDLMMFRSYFCFKS